MGSRFIQDRRLRADVLFIRAQSVIRADGAPSAQALSLQLEVSFCMRQGWMRRHRARARRFGNS